MKRIIIYKSQKKALILMISSFLITLTGCLLLQYTDRNVIGWSLILLSALTLLFSIGTLFDRKSKIILTSRGIMETSNIREEIEWDAIRGVDEFFFRGQYYVRLLLDRNYKPSLIRPTLFYRFDRIYEKEGLKALFIPVSFLNVNSFRLSEIIRKMVKAEDREEILKSL